MTKEQIIFLCIVGLAIFVWLPAIVLSIRRALRSDKKNQKSTNN